MRWVLGDEGANLPIGQINELSERPPPNPGRRRVIWNFQERGMWVGVKRSHILQRGLPDVLIPRDETREYFHQSIRTVGLSRWTSLRITSMEESRAASSWRVIAFYSITHKYIQSINQLPTSLPGITPKYSTSRRRLSVIWRRSGGGWAMDCT